MPGPNADAPVVGCDMPQEFLLPRIRLNAKDFPYKQHGVVAVQLTESKKRVNFSVHISYYAFFIFFGRRVASDGWGGAWRVTFGVTFYFLRYVLFFSVGVWCCNCRPRRWR
jgi:hypothetical protein